MKNIRELNIGILLLLLISALGQASEIRIISDNTTLQTELIRKMNNESILQTNNMWYVLRDGANPVHYTEIYKVEGDTLIDEQTWKIISYTTDPDDAANQNWQTRLYLLASGSELLCSTPDDLTPKLYFDFAAQPGDSLTLFCPFFNEFSLFEITSIDTITMHGVERKRFMSKVKSKGEEDDLWFENAPWIEGIGSENGIFYGNPQPYLGSQFDLTCFHVDGILYYPEDPFESCFLSNVGFAIIRSDADITVYPNPTKGIVNIRGNDINSRSIISISTLDGATSELFSELQVSNTMVVDLKSYPTGIYILKIQNKQGLIKVVKIMKW